jgi:hypothetical protein
LPHLLPFVEPGGAVNGMNDKLFVRASARNLAEIRQLVAALDTPQRRLMISLRQDGATADRIVALASAAGWKLAVPAGRHFRPRPSLPVGQPQPA